MSTPKPHSTVATRMSGVREDWLHLTQEEVLEPDLAIVDPEEGPLRLDDPARSRPDGAVTRAVPVQDGLECSCGEVVHAHDSRRGQRPPEP